MRKRTIELSALMCLLLILSLFLWKKYEQNQMQNMIDVSDIKNVPVICLEPLEYIEMPSQTDNGHALTCTGLCYDKIGQTWFIGNYGREKSDDKDFYPSIVNVSADFYEINYTIPFDGGDQVDIQGVAYDKETSSLWYTNGEQVINCDPITGEEISRFSIGDYSKYKANGICLDLKDGTLWILCRYKFLLHFSKDGTLIDKVICEYLDQDHICMDDDGLLYISIGADYQGENNYVLCMDREANIQKLYQMKESYAIEGIVLLDNRLYVVNDGIYHESKIKKNYIQIYDIQK